VGDTVGPVNRLRRASFAALVAITLVILLGTGAIGAGRAMAPIPADTTDGRPGGTTPVDNFTAAIDRLVELLGLAGGGLLSLVWARVALSWFSNDVTKKVQAKDRARDALIGTLLFVAAVTGLFWGLAHWVLTGS
jgi:hypothetical protein